MVDVSDATCCLPGCSQPVYVQMRGWCREHYRHWRKYGDPLRKPTPPPCDFPGCSKSVYIRKRGLCLSHHLQGRQGPRATCSVQGCSSPYSAKGMCAFHYKQRWEQTSGRRTGRAKRQRPTPEEKFWANVDKNGPIPTYRPDLGPCWIWTGPLSSGYGRLNGQGAYRFAYELLTGPIPEKLQIDHLCRVSACVRPDHLEPVTRRENALRGLAARRKE